jgi:hypothetical protein
MADSIVPARLSADVREGSRYLVVGNVRLEAGSHQVDAELVNIGPAGLLAFSDAALPLGDRIDLRIAVQGYPAEVRMRGRVVHSAVGLIGVGFLDVPADLAQMLQWLEAQLEACLQVS